MTTLLPPSLAVESAWALTIQFSKDAPASASQVRVTSDFERLADLAEKQGGLETRYVSQALVLVDATARTLHLAVSGRDLFFVELDDARKAHLDELNRLSQTTESVPANLRLVISAVAALGLGGAGAVGLFSDWLHAAQSIVVLGAVVIAIVVFVTWFLFLQFIFHPWQVRLVGKQVAKKLYDRNMHYSSFMAKSRIALVALYARVNELHTQTFGVAYTGDPSADDVIELLFHGAETKSCPLLAQHMREERVSDKEWALCESGWRSHANVAALCPVYDPTKDAWPDVEDH